MVLLKTHPRLRRTLIGLATGAWAVLGLGCSDDETEFNVIDRFRVLGLAADPPALRPGEAAELSILTVNEEETRVEHVWEWCPLTLGAQTGYECAFTEEDLQMQVDQQLGPGVFEVPDFLLGTSSTAEYAFDIPAQAIQAVCDFIQQQELPTLVEAPDCSEGFPLTIISTVRQIEVATNLEGPVDSAGPTRIRAVKSINLLYSEDLPNQDPPNQNPKLGELFVIDPRDESRRMVAADGSTVLERDVAYTLQIEFDAAEAEEYEVMPPDATEPETVREDLTLTWFIEAGSTEFIRTGLIDDGIATLEDAQTNEWTTPTAADFESTSARVFIVIRDGRFGTSWIERAFTLADSI